MSNSGENYKSKDDYHSSKRATNRYKTNSVDANFNHERAFKASKIKKVDDKKEEKKMFTFSGNQSNTDTLGFNNGKSILTDFMCGYGGSGAGNDSRKEFSLRPMRRPAADLNDDEVEENPEDHQIHEVHNIP